MSTSDNTLLIKQMKAGNMKAFDTIYHQYCNRLFGFVMKLIKEKNDAEEIVQEVFTRLWASRQQIDEYASFDSYLFTITYNTSMSLLRKRLSEKKYMEHLGNIQDEVSEANAIEEIQYSELNQKYKDILNQLTPRQKEIFLLSREEGLTHKEIAAKLGISKNTVEIHISNALNFIKNNLDKTLIINTLFFELFIS